MKITDNIIYTFAVFVFSLIIGSYVLVYPGKADAQAFFNCDGYTSQWKINSLTPKYESGKYSFVISGNFPHMKECGKQTYIGSTTSGYLAVIGRSGWGDKLYYINDGTVMSASDTSISLSSVYSFPDASDYYVRVYYCLGTVTSLGGCTTVGFNSISLLNRVIATPPTYSWSVTCTTISFTATNSPILNGTNYRMYAYDSIRGIAWYSPMFSIAPQPTGTRTFSLSFDGRAPYPLSDIYPTSGTYKLILEKDGQGPVIPSESKTLSCLSSSPFKKTAPADNENLSAVENTFTWAAYTGRIPFGRYILEFKNVGGVAVFRRIIASQSTTSTSVNFTNPVASTGTDTVLVNPPFVAGQKYTWQVAMNNGADTDTADGNTPWSFTYSTLTPYPKPGCYKDTSHTSTGVTCPADTACNGATGSIVNPWSAPVGSKCCAVGCASSVTDTPTPTMPVSCMCGSNDSCSTSCTFAKYTSTTISNVSYSDPLGCSLSSVSFSTTLTQTHKNQWCQRNLRTKGDATGDGKVDDLDYFYYVQAVTGGNLPIDTAKNMNVNPDFSGNGSVGTDDRIIIIHALRNGL